MYYLAYVDMWPKGMFNLGLPGVPFGITIYFIWYTSPPSPFLALAEKKGFITCRIGYLS